MSEHAVAECSAAVAASRVATVRRERVMMGVVKLRK